MVGRFDESVHLPDLIGRQSHAEGRHLRALAALDHRLQELLVGELGGEDVRAARAGAVVADVAFAGVDVAAGGDGVGLAEERVRQFVSPLAAAIASSDIAAANGASERSRELRIAHARDQGFAAGSIFSITCAL